MVSVSTITQGCLNEISGVRGLELIQNLCFVIIYLNGRNQPINKPKLLSKFHEMPATGPGIGPNSHRNQCSDTFFMSLSFCLKMVTVLSSMSTSN